MLVGGCRYGVELEAKGLDYKTPLHLASLHGHVDMVHYLLERGEEDNSNQQISPRGHGADGRT